MRKSQIKYPVHVVKDAQGPMGIMDAEGKAIVWFSDVFSPAKGWIWEYPFDERNELVEAIEAFIKLRRKIETR